MDEFFQPCPDSPNCVSTEADPTDEVHYVEEIPHNGSEEEVYERLVEIVRSMPRTTIVEQAEPVLRAEFRSAVFRFVDDVHIVVLNDSIAFYSASRVGYSDMGVNRKRYEDIREAFLSGE